MDGVAKCFDLMDAIMNLRMQGGSLEGGLYYIYSLLRSTKVNIANKNEIRCFDGFPKHNSGIRLPSISFLS